MTISYVIQMSFTHDCQLYHRERSHWPMTVSYVRERETSFTHDYQLCHTEKSPMTITYARERSLTHDCQLSQGERSLNHDCTYYYLLDQLANHSGIVQRIDHTQYNIVLIFISMNQTYCIFVFWKMFSGLHCYCRSDIWYPWLPSVRYLITIVTLRSDIF